MTTISLFTSVSYVRPKSYAEGALSAISHFFYLGGIRAKVIIKDEVQLEPGKISCRAMTLKVASFVLLFPLTLTLLAINLGLRYQHNFTVISPSTIQPKKELHIPHECPTIIEIGNDEVFISSDPHASTFYTRQAILSDVDKNLSITLSKDQAQVISATLSTQKGDEEPFLEIHQKPKESSHSVATVTAQNVESVGQQVLVPPSLVESHSQLSEKSPSSTTSLDEMPVKHSKAISSEKVGPLLLDKEVQPISLDKFKETLKYFSSYEKDPEEIAAELFENIPQHLELTVLTDFIFNECRPYSILDLLNAILIAYPSFTLSPYDQIRKAIVADEDHTLNNNSLIALLKEQSLEKDEERLTACYNLAYRLNHPYIYRLSRTPILSSDYNLNFLWVNLNPQDRIEDTAQNIFGDGLNSSENAECIKDPKVLRTTEENEKSLENEELENWKKVKKSFTYRISKWADVNPGAQINLWYDSALVTQKAQKKTFEMMRDISKSRGVNLRLRDIRQLSNISGEIGNCFHPGTQVYYRVDLLKALIADHMMSSSEESAQYCIVSDIDVEPMSPEQMFDQRTVDYLSTNGYVFNKIGFDNFENSFFIFNKAIKDIQKIHNKSIIQRAASTIAKLREYSIKTVFRDEFILGAQSVFNLYRIFRRKMKERSGMAPRKVVKCPTSQFNFGGSFSKSDYQSETFRFIGASDIPYTINGRNFDARRNKEKQIAKLIKWKAEPLTIS